MHTNTFARHIEDFAGYWRKSKLEYEEAPTKSGMEKLCDALKVGLTLIGGCPKMGCSTFAVALAMELAKNGRKVLYCAHSSQDIKTIINHYISSEAKLDMEFDFHTKEELIAIEEVLNKLMDIPFYTAEIFGETSLQELEAHIWNEVRDKHIDYIFIDCLQDINVDQRIVDKRTFGEFISDRFRHLSLLLDVPVILCAYQEHSLDFFEDWENYIPKPSKFMGGHIDIYARQMYLLFRPTYYYFYQDDKTGEDLRGKMIVYARGGVGGLNEEIRLLYDLPFARIKDINNRKEEKTGEANNMKIEVKMSKGETIKEEDLPF